MGWNRLAFVVLMAMTVGGCTSTTGSDPVPRAVNSSDASAQNGARGPAKCPVPHPNEHGQLELRGEASGEGELWALIFGEYPARQGQEIKIAWRMTGEGSLALSATGPKGLSVKPFWGPESHPTSNWNRPGDEWGSGWRFPAPGCWTVHLVRGSDHATAGIRVAG